MKTKSFITMDYFELEKLVAKHYPNIKDYEFVEVQECGNDTDHEFNGIGSQKYMNKYDFADIEEMKTTGKVKGWQNHLVLEMLCADGHIPKGDYLINVSW